MRSFARSLATAFALALALATAGATPAEAAGPLKVMTPLTLGGVGGLSTLITLPISVGLEYGILKKYNLDLTVVTVSGEAQSCQSALSGALDLSQCTTNTQLAASTKGGELVQIDNEMRLPLPYQVVTGPATTEWSQLKNKTILLSNERSNVTYFFDMMARAHGLSHSDFQFAWGVPTSVARLAAVKSGAASATLVSVPASLKVEPEGYHVLESTFSTPGLEADKFAGGGAVTARRWAEQHGDVLVAYILAFQEGVRWLYDPANKTAALALIAREYHVDSPALAEQIYAVAVGRHLFNAEMCTPASAEAGAIKAAITIGAVPPGDYPPERFAPNTWVERATHRKCS